MYQLFLIFRLDRYDITNLLTTNIDWIKKKMPNRVITDISYKVEYDGLMVILTLEDKGI